MSFKSMAACAAGIAAGKEVHPLHESIPLSEWHSSPFLLTAILILKA